MRKPHTHVLVVAAVLIGVVATSLNSADLSVTSTRAAAASAATAHETTSLPPRSPRNANYRIDARLDVNTHVLTATELITWRNITAHPTSELRLHLYHNAWANDRTSFAIANRFGPGSWSAVLADHGPDDWAYCEIISVRLVSGSVETSVRTNFIQPDDGNHDDRTVLQVLLPDAVAPDETVALRVEWRQKEPRPFQRTGVMGDYFLVGQWFPKVGVLEADGTWNCHQFIQTEFYADFGVYDVRLTVPSGWIVGATGRRTLQTANPDGTVTHTYRAEDVHDFGWTASPRFTVYQDRFEERDLPPVQLELLLLPDHAALKDRYLAAAKETLRAYGRWFRPYAYDRLTIVDPPYESQTDSMEYPMFVTGGSRWLTSRRNRFTEADTIHEVGHQWWYGAVANNEMEDAWLDEGVNTYAHKRLLEVIYAPKIYEKHYFHDFIPFEFPGVPIAQNMHGADEADGFRSVLKREPLSTASWRADESLYFALPYNKGGLMLTTLERHLGWERWRRVMAAYADRFWFKHPKPADFFAVVNEVSGEDLTWFFDEAYKTSNLFDYAVGRVDSRRTAVPDYVSTVDIRRWGEARFPVAIRVTFADGSIAGEKWDGQGRWTRFRYSKPARVTRVEVDPNHTLVLDVNYANNSWTSQPNAAAASVKWTSKWIVWLQSVMELAAFFS